MNPLLKLVKVLTSNKDCQGLISTILILQHGNPSTNLVNELSINLKIVKDPANCGETSTIMFPISVNTIIMQIFWFVRKQLEI